MTRDELVEKARGFLFRRQAAYRRTFQGPLADVVLRDLAKFCRANESTASADPYVASRLDGRRECWLRIQNHLNLTQERLWDLHNRSE